MRSGVNPTALSTARARAVEQRLATFTMDCEIGFASPAAFRAFTEELASQVATLASKYDTAARSRRFRVVVGSHPVVTKTAADAAAETAQHQGRQQLRNKRNSARRAR